VDGGEPLPGKIEELTARRRIARDEATGEPLPIQPTDAELVVFAKLSYAFQGRPATLSIQPPLHPGSKYSAANVGFVAYHNGLPVNDFRYLFAKSTLDLDWNDPWYSRFRHPNLRRKFDAPISVFLYIEPFEVRKEIIVRPKDLETWLDLGIEDDGVIAVDQQEELKDRVARFLAGKNPVKIDGRVAAGRLDRIHFIHRTLRSTGVIEPPQELNAASATLGVIFVYPIQALPQEVSMNWELFSKRIKEIPAVASDEAGGLSSTVTPDDPVMRWKNFLTNPTVPRLASIAPPPTQQEFAVPVMTTICCGLLVGLLMMLCRSYLKTQKAPAGVVVALLVVVICGVALLPYAKIALANPFAEPTRFSDEEARDVLGGLLHNIYRAFDHRDESLIYDQLSQSITGDLLAQVYLQTRQSMEVKNQGGLRITVKEVTIGELARKDQTSDSGWSFRCRWRVSGSIGHWGHMHRRANEHLANITVAPIDARWKITAIEMLDEQAIGLPKTLPNSQ